MSDERVLILLGELKGKVETLAEALDRRFQDSAERSASQHALRDRQLDDHKADTADQIATLTEDLRKAISMISEVHAKLTEAKAMWRTLLVHGGFASGYGAMAIHAIKAFLGGHS